jgi:phage gp37-like protein
MTKDLISLRVPKSLIVYARTKSQTHNINQTEILNEIIKTGLANIKEVNQKLDEKRKYALEIMLYEENAELIKHVLRKAYLEQNTKKLLHQLRTDANIKPERIKEVEKALINRMKEALGEESEEYKTHVKK